MSDNNLKTHNKEIEDIFKRASSELKEIDNVLAKVTGDFDEDGNIANPDILQQLGCRHIPLKDNNDKEKKGKIKEDESKSKEDWSTSRLFEMYENLKNVTLKNMPNLWPGLEFALSVKTILNINRCTLPFAGIILGPASSLKTSIIELFRGHKHTFYTDNFSPKSLVSHNSAVKKEKLKEIDMLPKMKNKLFLTPELAPVFAARDDDLLQILGILTRVADGHGYESDSGAQGHRGYNERIMYAWLGASVDIPYKVHKLLGNLGPKLYFFRLPRIEETEDYYYNTRHESFAEKLQEIREALLEYLAYFEMNPDIIMDEDEGLPKISLNSERDEELAYRIIIRLAKLLGHLRALVPTWETKDTQGSEYAYTLAKIEDPSRAITQLRNLARGHALSMGRSYITEDDIPVVIHTALSTATLERTRVFELLLENKGRLTTAQIVNFLNTTKPTALRTMVELKAIGLVDVTYHPDQYNSLKEMSLKSEFDWFLSDKFTELRRCKEKTPPPERSTDILVEDRGYKENYPPRTPPLFLYEYTINKKSNIYRIDSLQQNVCVRGEDFSLQQNKGIEKRFIQQESLSYGTTQSESSGEIAYTCVYCSIIGGSNKINPFDSEDSYVRHVVKKHKGWPAFHGPADIEKFRQTLNEKGRV
ncbi:MAG: hypothetical protein GEU26_13810 [Nitrososphaeraceae archaeon]|nr:hypothetical protein [Nitrososphaeraceae archaeon]